MSVLEIQDLKVCYGGIVALNGISFSVDEGRIVTLIGANGAGKSTTLRSIMGLVPITSGTITYNGVKLNGMDTRKIVEMGLVLVPEGRRVFPNLTTLENLKIGGYLQDKVHEQQNLERVYELFPRLKERHWQLAGTLSDGWTVESSALDTGRISFIATGTPPLAGSGTLAYVEMLVLLGNDLTTDVISSDTSRFLTGGAKLAVSPGTFTLQGYCTVGGNRLVRVTNDFGIKAVSPNPARNRIAVDFELVEDGPTSLTLYDMLGRRAAVLLDTEMTAQPHHLEAELALPQGVYLLELTTPTQRRQERIVIGR